jgi:hypothetical protein
MAIEIPALSAAITVGGTTVGIVTVASTTGFFVGAKCTVAIAATGVGAREVEIVEIPSSTTLALRFMPSRTDPSQEFGPRGLPAPNFGRSNMSSILNTYTIYQHQQQISVARTTA